MPEVKVDIRDDIAWVTIDNPPVNALGQAVRAGLLAAVEQVSSSPEVQAVVLTGAGKTFVAGADINELGKEPLAPFLPDVLAAIENCRAPWIAAINGNALGGGLELAMACRFRIASPAASLGLPETTLGIIPGSGGTVRLPRLVPLSEAISLVTTGKPVKAERALEIGLVDEVSSGDVAVAAGEQARRLISAGAPSPTILRQVRDGDVVDWDSERAAIERRSRGSKAPLEALDALRDTATLPADKSLARERERFLRLSKTEEAAALRHAFFSERAAGKSLRNLAEAPADLSQVGVIGGGTMGAGIATALLLSGSAVCILERDTAAADAAVARISDNLAASVKRNVITAARADAANAALTTATEYKALSNCDVIIEAVFEDMDVKKAVFEQLAAVVSDDAILATNTSYLDVNVLAAATPNPSRVLGLHFFSPAHVMKLLEIVRGDETGARALATGGALAKRLKKIAVVSGVCRGFIGNRIMAAYRRDCEFMLQEGALPWEIDAAMRDFGFPMGIFEVQDLSGLDIAWAQRKAAAATRPADERYSRISDRLCEAGRLGRKTGKGWYDYTDGKQSVDPAVELIVAEESARAGYDRRSFTSGEIMDRVLGIMQAEGQAILAEGIAEASGDIDVVMISGYGFPRHRGGPMFMLENH